jgi:hypothetical protein
MKKGASRSRPYYSAGRTDPSVQILTGISDEENPD